MFQKFLGVCSLFLVVLCDERHKFADQHDVHDQEHLKLHLQNQIDMDKGKLDEEKQKFHYFSMHDLNRDNLIDGLEIMKGMMHTHSDNNLPVTPDEDLESMIDMALNDFDTNKDGFIDFAEYRRRS